jgi:Uma2 family endonuclease
MVAALKHFPRFTPAEYLDWEEQQEFRNEFVNGEVYAMTGGTINHSKIAVNLTIAIGSHLQRGNCQLLNSDAKVKVAESEAFFYPDLSVTCDERDNNADKFINHPCLIVEVLSPATEAYDRGEKFRMYRRSPSLQEYVLVSTTAINVEVFGRDDQGQWLFMAYSAGDMVALNSLDFLFPIEQIYTGIAFDVAEQ